MSSSGHALSTTDPYADRQLVPEESTHRALALYKSFINNPTTDVRTRLSCLAKTVSILDALPVVRGFDSAGKFGVNRNTGAQPANLSLLQLLVDRTTMYRGMSAVHRQLGDVQNAAFGYDRTTLLLEALIRNMNASQNITSGDHVDGAATQPTCFESERHLATLRVYSTNMLLQVLGDWRIVEQALGRNSKADKLLARAEKWRASRDT
ncbi:hypothetical protein BX661DRAFT_187768 [Kickxella alabastrina]|uniref:uncharacterized protein n=1 Tax=Kickxella alabastrina TaxID=61397 RepID=UPI00221FCD2B|nr:uncharacterized protein BX661DRAFT_187768 [Kickxella alabastrina]KAI7822112.1 hypothetical protein BX661DRAFT_187768 [Kickxella alabastrina]KAJ1947379.1 hypothetical protein GGF37_000451 [Kickxella alabastrina]